MAELGKQIDKQLKFCGKPKFYKPKMEKVSPPPLRSDKSYSVHGLHEASAKQARLSKNGRGSIPPDSNYVLREMQRVPFY